METTAKEKVDIDDAEHAFQIPTKQVKGPQDIAKWEHSESYYEIIGFINTISLAVQGIKITDKMDISPQIEKLLKMFEELNKLVDDTPAVCHSARFGNKSYRDWYQKYLDNSIDLLKNVLPEQKHRAIPEIISYLSDSFGNSTRIDYGTGHELAFVMFLCCLFKINFLNEEDKVACCLHVFHTYLIFVRKLQQTYRMEPAGSHGVWSLDDFQFIPFIWGSAQLCIKSPIEPAQFPEQNVVERFKNDYMFIGCIDYILKVKTGLFAEHSNQLWSISAVPEWTKINAGLVKMYLKENLSKFPIIQHVLFGSLLTLNQVKPGLMLPSVRLGIAPQKPVVSMPPPAPKPAHEEGSGDTNENEKN